MSEPTDAIADAALPRGAQGGVELCHSCAIWRATELVHDVDGVPTCEVCDPTLAPEPMTDDPPVAIVKRSASKRTTKKTPATRRTRR